jgi:hypothetical protein
MSAVCKLASESARLRDRLVKRRTALSAILKRQYSCGNKTEAKLEMASIAGKIEILNWLDGRLRTLSLTDRKEKDDG